MGSQRISDQLKLSPYLTSLTIINLVPIEFQVLSKYGDLDRESLLTWREHPELRILTVRNQILERDELM